MSNVESNSALVTPDSLPPLPIGFFDEAGAMVDTSTLDDPREHFCDCYNSLRTGRIARPILVTARPVPADGAAADAAASKGNLSAALPDALALAELPGGVVSFDYWSHEVGGFEPRIIVVEVVEDAGRLIVGEDLIRGGRRKFRTALIRDLAIEARDESHAVLWVDGDGQPVGMLVDGISSATARAVEATANRFLVSAGSEGRWAKVVPMADLPAPTPEEGGRGDARYSVAWIEVEAGLEPPAIMATVEDLPDDTRFVADLVEGVSLAAALAVVEVANNFARTIGADSRRAVAMPTDGEVWAALHLCEPARQTGGAA